MDQQHSGTLPRSVVFMLSHSSAGGAQEIMADIAEGFVEAGSAVRMVALYPTDKVVRDERLEWEFIVPTKPKSPLAMAAMGLALVRWFRRERPDVVLTALPAANLMAALGSRLAGNGTRVIISHHSPVETHNPLINFADGYAGRLKSVCSIVSVSNAVAASLDGKAASYRAKRRTIHNALPPRLERLLDELGEARRAAGRDGGARGRRVVATGRLAAQKNYQTLIRAAAHMPDVTIDILGDGPDRAALLALAAEVGVTGRVRFLGMRPREDALRLLADGDVFAQVSLFEGHSLALIEAAKLGLPLVVSDVPVQVEGVTARDGTSCASIVPVLDDRALATAIIGLLDDPAHYRTQAEAARRLGGEATYAAMLGAYRELAA